MGKEYFGKPPGEGIKTTLVSQMKAIGNTIVLGPGSVECILSGGQADDPEPGFRKHCMCETVAPRVCAYGTGCDCGADNVVMGKEYLAEKPGKGIKTTSVPQMEAIGDVLVLGSGSVECFLSRGQADPEPWFYKHCICDSPLIM